MSRKSESLFREIHRYLGFFLAGIMAVYAISGIVLTFRNTDWLRKEVAMEKQLDPGLEGEELGKALGFRRFEVTGQEGDVLIFGNGTYNTVSGQANYTVKRQPYIVEKMNKLHKMHSGHPLFWLGIFFAVSLLFFSVSAFFMFRPSAPIFKKGLYFAVAGFLLTLVLLFV